MHEGWKVHHMDIKSVFLNGDLHQEVYAEHHIFYSIAARFPYLVEQDLDDVARPTRFCWRIVNADVNKPFVSSGLEFVPLPVRVATAELLFFLSYYL
jgi:hypothetical protein